MRMAATQQQTGGPRERERASKAVFIEGSIDLELAPQCRLLSGGGQGAGVALNYTRV